MEDYWLRYYDDVSRTGVPIRIENYWADGDRWLSAHFSRVGDTGSNLVAVVFDDISERKRAEIALREGEEKYRQMLAAAERKAAELHAVIESIRDYSRACDWSFIGLSTGATLHGKRPPAIMML